MKLRLDLDNFNSCPQYNDWLDQQYIDQCGTLEFLVFSQAKLRVVLS